MTRTARFTMGGERERVIKSGFLSVQKIYM